MKLRIDYGLDMRKTPVL